MSEKTNKIKKSLTKFTKNKTEYSFDDFNKLVDNINDDLDSIYSSKKIKKVICNHLFVENNKILFDLNSETSVTYKEIKKIFKKSETETSENIPKKKSGFGVFNKDCDTKSTNNVFKKKTGFGVFNKDDNSDDIKKSIDDDIYIYPNSRFNCSKKLMKYPFNENTWINDDQFDDELTKEHKKLSKQVNKLIVQNKNAPEQKSKEWLDMRRDKITASDGGCVLGQNHYEEQWKFLLKKCDKVPFLSNFNCYNGNKYEEIAILIYEYRLNVRVAQFSLLPHPNIQILAASPDGIVSEYKNDGIHKTKYVGRMVEIKCPVTRQIKFEGEVRGDICPIYYWIQIQQQLECCDLEECDFWQCKILEYNDREEFIDDTLVNEPFRSKSTKNEKGCLIQLLPKEVMKDIVNGDEKKYLDITYEHAKFIHPPKIEMSPVDCDIWISEILSNLHKTHSKYCFDRVLYWKLVTSNCTLIKRDREWFKENLPIYEKMWNYVVYLRENEETQNIFFDWIYSLPSIKRKKGETLDDAKHRRSEEIMNVMDKLYNEPKKDDKKGQIEYAKFILQLKDETQNNKNIEN